MLGPAKYHIARSASNNYPVYTDYKRGGNLHTTVVRKITGDVQALRDELRLFLGKQDDQIFVNNLTKQVIVKVCVHVCGDLSCGKIKMLTVMGRDIMYRKLLRF